MFRRMTRHGKNCTAGAVYTYHEKKKDTGTLGSSPRGRVWPAIRSSVLACLWLPCVY